jgi:chitinase
MAITNERRKGKQKKGLKTITYRSIEIQENGDLIVSAEEDYITVHTTMGANGSMSTYTIQHYDDIIALRLSNKGDLLWSRNINKAQTGYANSSFTTISLDNKTHYFMNCSDNIRKLRDDRIQFRQTSSKKSNLYVITLNDEGVFDYKKLIDDKVSKVFYKVNQGVIAPSKNEVILLGKKKKNSRIIKIKI